MPGYLPGYLREEGYATGNRFALVTWLVPHAWAPAAVAVILGLASLAAMRTGSADAPWHSAALVVGTAIMLAAPSYTWYALLLVVLVGLGARPEWLTVAAGGYLAQYARDEGLATLTAQRLGYGVALAAVLLGWWIRRSQPQLHREL